MSNVINKIAPTMSSSKDDTLNYQNLRLCLQGESMPSAPIYDTVPCVQNLLENAGNVSKREEMIPLCASPSLDAKKRLRIEAEIKKAKLRKEQLIKERQIMEEEFKANEMLLDAEFELVLSNLDDSEQGSELNNTSSSVDQRNKVVNSFNAQNQVLEVQQKILNESRIQRPVESPKPMGLEQLSVLDNVSIRQLVSNSLDESYEVVAPEDVVILRANLTFELGHMGLLGERKTIKVDMFDSEVNELVNLRVGITNFMELYVNGQLACLIRRALTYFKPMLVLHDSKGRPALKIKGPNMGSDRLVFSVQTMEKVNIGLVNKNSAFVPSGYVSSNHTIIKFPLDLDVRFKAAIIASSFLLVTRETVKLRKLKAQAAILNNCASH